MPKMAFPPFNVLRAARVSGRKSPRKVFLNPQKSPCLHCTIGVEHGTLHSRGTMNPANNFHIAGLMVAGGFILLLGFCGCCGALKEWRILLAVVCTSSCDFCFFWKLPQKRTQFKLRGKLVCNGEEKLFSNGFQVYIMGPNSETTTRKTEIFPEIAPRKIFPTSQSESQKWLKNSFLSASSQILLPKQEKIMHKTFAKNQFTQKGAQNTALSFSFPVYHHRDSYPGATNCCRSSCNFLQRHGRSHLCVYKLSQDTRKLAFGASRRYQLVTNEQFASGVNGR